MYKFSFLSFFLVLFLSAKAQDRIITTTNDTIHCTIVSINNERVLYELKTSEGSVDGKFITLSQVAEYSRSHQPKKNSKLNKLKAPNPIYIPDTPWCLSLNLGGSTMPWYFDHVQSTYAMPDYYKKIKNGFHINASAHYMIKSYLGLGVEYSFFKTSTSGILQRESSPSIFFSESEKYRQFINYFGVSVLFQQHLDAKRKFILSESLSAGFLFLRLENQFTYPNFSQSSYVDITNKTLFTGKSLSGKLGLTAEYRLFEDVSVGLGCDFLLCTLKKARFESNELNEYSYSTGTQELTEPIKLSRIDYSFILRYYF